MSYPDLISRYDAWRESYMKTMQELKPMGFDPGARREIAKQIAPGRPAEIFILILPIATSNGCKPLCLQECIDFFDQLGAGASYDWSHK